MAESTVRVMCPNLRCRAILAVPTEARGKMVRCRSCGMNILVPKKQAAPVDSEGGGAEKPPASKK